MSSLIAKEKEVEKILAHLELYSKDKTAYDINLLKNELSELVSDWDKLLGKSGAIVDASAPLLIHLSQEDNAEILYYIFKPLEFYMTALEEMVNSAFRNAATRCGMFCERVVNILLRVINGEQILREISSFENKVGRLESDLNHKNFRPAQGFCQTMRTIYGIRDTRGPHDVPSADEILAKFSLTACPFCYAEYSEALDLVRPGIATQMESYVKLVNSVLWVSPKLALGPGGRKLNVAESIEIMLYRNGFFVAERTFDEIKKKLLEEGYTFPDGTLANTLKRLAEGAFLWRKNSKRGYVYIQRMPAQEYYLHPKNR